MSVETQPQTKQKTPLKVASGLQRREWQTQDFRCSPTNANRQRDHPRGNSSRIGVVISRFSEDLKTSLAQFDVEPTAQTAAYTVARNVAEHLISLHQRVEKPSEEWIEDHDRKYYRPGELDSAPIIPEPTHNIEIDLVPRA